ncbi:MULTISPECIES: TMEM175 family protein [Lacticaseibacillus]|uniref:TMEM175 family protein n=1 Tax=Lacticaseibacillus hegangensis TaxID=2486010 RepID=A0ABW4CXV0_9LACO|nr:MULTISPECIES: TMEM175 family protein [Lacticaseibacillus]
MSKSRIDALSDGVFAILLTILILEFQPETIKPGSLNQVVLHQAPLFLMYLLSYFYVGTSWLFHHDYFQYVKRTNRTLNVLNLFVLFTVTLVNYAMVLLIEALSDGNTSDIRLAFIVYDLVALLISLSFLLLYRYLEHHPELQTVERSGITSHYERIRLDPARSVSIYLLSMIATSFSNLVAGILLIAGVVFHFIAYLRFSRVVHIATNEKTNNLTK